MQNSPLDPAAAPLPAETNAPLVRRWWQQSVWWSASALLLVLGAANAPTAWILARDIDGLSQTLAWCGVGSILAQLVLFALLLAGTAETWGRRLTRAYPIALTLFALTAGGWYLQAVFSQRPIQQLRTHELIVRRDIGGVVLLAVEALLIGVFVAVLMCDHYQAKFVHRLGNPPTDERLKWTLRDMLVWMTFLAATLAFIRFIPWNLTLSPTDGYLGGLMCTAILGWLFCFLCLATIMECYVHSPRSEAVWKHKYNWILLIVLAGLVTLDGSGLLVDLESTACRIASAMFAFCATIALAIAALERCGWRLVICPKPRKSGRELASSFPQDSRSA